MVKKCPIIVIISIFITYIVVKHYNGNNNIGIYSPFSIFFSANKRTYSLKIEDRNSSKKSKFVQLSTLQTSQKKNCIQIKQTGFDKLNLIKEFYICRDENGNFFQLYNNKKAIIYQNVFVKNTFHPNNLFSLFNKKYPIVDAWCTQKLEQKTIFKQNRNIVRLYCSALYDTPLKKEITDKKVIRNSIIFAEGLGLYMMKIKIYDENNKTLKSIEVLLDKVEPVT